MEGHSAGTTAVGVDRAVERREKGHGDERKNKNGDFAETAMRTSLREVLKQCRSALRKMSAKRDRWVKEWPSQPGITSTQIQWTTDCTRTLQHCK